MHARMLAVAALLVSSACAPVSGPPAFDGDTRGLLVAVTDMRLPAVPAQRQTERVFAGDAVYVDGRFASAPVLMMSAGFEARLAGQDGTPVEFRLPPLQLGRARTDGRTEHYCADVGAVGVRPSPEPGLCVGVRHDRESGQSDWVVATLADDGVLTAASAPVSPEAGVRFSEGRRVTVDRRTLVEEIVFEGYDDGEIRFVRTLYRAQGADTETFGFAYPPRSGIPVYRIGGQALEVTAVTAAEIEYRLQPL